MEFISVKEQIDLEASQTSQQPLMLNVSVDCFFNYFHSFWMRPKPFMLLLVLGFSRAVLVCKRNKIRTDFILEIWFFISAKLVNFFSLYNICLFVFCFVLTRSVYDFVFQKKKETIISSSAFV